MSELVGEFFFSFSLKEHIMGAALTLGAAI